MRRPPGTYHGAAAVGEDLRHLGADEDASARLLDLPHQVKRDLGAAAARELRAVDVVVREQRLHEETALRGLRACINTRRNDW